MRKCLFAITALIVVGLSCGQVVVAADKPQLTHSFSEVVDGYSYAYIVYIPGFYRSDDYTVALGRFTEADASTKWEFAVYPKPKGGLIIPSTLWRYPISFIMDNAFQDCTELTSVTIPEGVRLIHGAFKGCERLASVTFPSSVTFIGADAFSGCKSLRDISIPESVTSVDKSAFLGTALWDNQPDGVVYIDGWVCGYKGDKPSGRLVLREGTRMIAEGAFEECGGLTGVVIPEGVRSIGGRAFGRCKNLTDVTIPPSVREIGGMAFWGCKGLTDITIPPTVRNIGDNAFAGCDGLTRVTIPEGVATIGRNAFYGCKKLTSLTIPSSVTSLGGNIVGWTPIWHSFPENSVVYLDGWACGFHREKLSGQVVIKDGTKGIADSAFVLSGNMTSVVIPGSVKTFGRQAFDGCGSLADVTIQPGVTSISDWAFVKCASLNSVVIPEGVTSIGALAFAWCKSLESVTIPTSVTSIGDAAFYGCDLTSVVIPEGVTSIGARTFSDCRRLTSITIPPSVTNIADAAFAGTSLTCVTFPASLAHAGRWLFSDAFSLRKALFLGNAPNAGQIYVGAHEELTTYVLPGSTGWDGNFNSETLPALWEERKILHVSSEPLVATSAKAAKPAEVSDFHAWLDKRFPGNNGDYEALAARVGANGYTVWDSYVAGLDPTDSKDKFRASITMQDGTPVITWEPNLRTRVYTVVGKESLTDPGDWGKTNNLTRFFKVKVQLPE